MNNSKSQKIILYSLVLAVLVLFAGYYFFYQDIKTKNQHTSSLLNELSQEQTRKDYLISTQKTVKDIDSDISRLNNSFIASGGDVKFIESLESIARENGLEIDINSLNFEEDKELLASGVVFLKVKARVRGTWLANYKLLAELESLPFKIRIDSFHLTNDQFGASVDSKVNNVPQWSNTFEISVLKYK